MMKRFLMIFLGLVITMFLYPQPGLTQSNEELKKEFDSLKQGQNTIWQEINSLKQGQNTIHKDLQEIKRLLARRGPAPFKEIVIDVKGDPFKGDEKAKIALIELADYQ